MVLPSSAKRKAADLIQHDGHVPGMTDKRAAATILMADVVARAGTRLLRKFVESAILKNKYDKETAEALMAKRSRTEVLASIALSRLATRSVPGAAVLGAGLVATTLYRRGKARRAARSTSGSEENSREA